MKAWEDLTRLGRDRRIRALVRRALEEYDLEIEAMRLLADETNTLFRLRARDGAQYVARVGLDGPIAHTLEDVAVETGWLAALARDTDLEVSRPVPDRRGRLAIRLGVPGVNEDRNVVIFRWIPGSLLDDRLTTGNLEAYGHLAASLHLHAESYRPQTRASLPRYDRVFPLDEPVVLFDPEHEQHLPSERRGLFTEAVSLVTDAIDRCRAREPIRLLHGDLHIWNVLVTRRGLAAIDFEDAMWGWPVQDIATALYYLQLRPDFDRCRASFRAGYEPVAPWPEQDPDEVDIFIAGRTLVLANDVLLLMQDPTETIDVPAFFARSELRLRNLLYGEPISAG